MSWRRTFTIMTTNNGANAKIEKLMETGEWFWSEKFINPHTNPLLNELERTYKQVLKTIKETQPLEIVNALLDLPIKTHVLLKHIMIILDTSAETLDRAVMYIHYNGFTGLTLDEKEIKFEILGPDYLKNMNNAAIAKANSGLKKDLLNILAFSSKSREFGGFETFKNCRLVEISGNKETLEEHLLFLSLRSSSQIKQLRAVDFGHQLEAYHIRGFLQPVLDDLGVYYTQANRYDSQQFDNVITDGSKYAIIEVAFQETTNSTLERKGKQAAGGLFKKIDDNGDKLIYIVDGAGYFKRRSALSDMVTYSHLACTVSNTGLLELEKFLIEFFS